MKDVIDFIDVHPSATYLDMLHFLKTLNAEQLRQPARGWGVNFSIQVSAINVLKTDWINPSGESCEPRGLYDQYEPGDEMHIDTTNEDVIYPDGTILLVMDDKHEQDQYHFRNSHGVDLDDNASERLQQGRHYLMGVEPKDLTVEDALEAFGFQRNGLQAV